MKKSMLQRRAQCQKNFWMWDQDQVVTKCVDCGRHLPIPYRFVCDAGGRITRAECPSCQTVTCVPVLKDHQTLACLTSVGE